MNESEYLQAKVFIYTDIQREINLAKISENFIGKFLLKTLIKYPGGANFMTAMALLCYTEAAGKIITGKDNQARANFLVFFEKLGPEYKNFKASHNVYDIFRCGLAHECYVKKNCTIYMLSRKATCGIGIDKTKKYFFLVERFFKDFKKAFNNLLSVNIKSLGLSGLAGGATTLSVQRY